MVQIYKIISTVIGLSFRIIIEKVANIRIVMKMVMILFSFNYYLSINFLFLFVCSFVCFVLFFFLRGPTNGLLCVTEWMTNKYLNKLVNQFQEAI